MQTGHREWITGTVTNNTQFPRSVMVQTGNGATYRRNNIHLHRTKANIRRPDPVWPNGNKTNTDDDNQNIINDDDTPTGSPAAPRGEDSTSFEPPDVPGGNVSAGEQATETGGNQEPNQATDSTLNRVSRSGRAIQPVNKYTASFKNKKY